MSQDTGQRAAEQVVFAEDELSIDDLDRIVGGLNSENPSGEGGSPSGEGGYIPPPPPVVHAPDHLPTEINQVEVNVATNHSITGDQAISQIAGIIGSQTDDHQQSIAGAEIASLIGRGIIDATTAMADLHNAVTQTHSLTGEQAAGILAGMVLAQTNTPGEAASIATAATTEASNLINASTLTADHAITAFAGLAMQPGGSVMLTEINSLAQQYSLTPAQVGTDIVAAVDNGDLTGTQGITVLASLATSFIGVNHPFVETAGHEIAGLIASHNIDPTDAMAAVTYAEYMGSNGLSDRQIPALMFAMVDANPALADAAGAELGTAVRNDPFYSFNGAFHSAVTSLGISADDTMAVLMGAAHAGATFFASEMVVQLNVNHTFNISQEMASIQNHVTTAGLADDAVTLLHALVNSGYASAYQQPAETALVAMINNHQITATQAANDLVGMVSFSTDQRGFELLMAIGEANAPDAASAVAAAVDHYVQGQGASAVVQALAMLVGGSSSVADNLAMDAVALQQISSLVSSGALTADAAIDALAIAAVSTFRWTGKEAICNEIVTIAAGANPPLDGAHVVAEVMGHAPAGYENDTILVLGFLAGHGHDLQVAAGAALVAMIDPNNYYVSNPSWVANDVTWWVTSGASTLSPESAVALLSAAVGNGSTLISPDIAGVAIAVLITNGHIPPARVTGDIHTAVVSGLISGDAALTLLANLAANAPTAQVAINTEMLALVTGPSPLVQPGHATDILTALHDAAVLAGNTAFVAILDAELAVLASSDPAIAVFNGLSTSTNHVDLETAAAQLAAAMASGAASIPVVMADIDQALANGTLTVLQAAELLLDIGCHGNFASQTAAGAELAKIVNTAGTGIFDYSGQLMTSQAIAALIGIGFGGYTYNQPAPSTHMTGEAAIAFMMGALGAPTTSEPTRLAFEGALSSLLTGNFYGIPVFFPAPSYNPPALYNELNSAINDVAAAHAMPGPEFIRAIFAMSTQQYFNAPQQLQTLITNHSVSMTDVNFAITAGWWQVDNAVQVLAGISSIPAVMTELASLITGNTITVDHFVNDLHQGLVHAWNATSVSGDDYALVMAVLAGSSDAATHAVVVDELAHAIDSGLLNGAQIQQILTGAGSGQAAMVDEILVALGGNCFGQLVNLNLVSLDHAVGLLSANGELYGAVTHAVTAGTYDVTLLSNGLAQSIANHTLSAGDANSMALQMAETADGTLANMAGALLAAVVNSGGMSPTAVMSGVEALENKLAHTQFGGPGINVPQMTTLLYSFLDHCDPGSSYAVARAAQELSQTNYYNFFPSPASALPFVIAAAHNANADSLYRIAGVLEGMIYRNEVTLGVVSAGISDLTGANAALLYADIAKYAASGGAGQIINDSVAGITALVPNRLSASAAVAALNDLLTTAPILTSANYALLSQAVGDQINAIATAYPDAGALSSIDDGIRAGTLTAVQAAQMLADMAHGGVPSAGVAAEINSLINQHLVTGFDIANAVRLSGNAHSLSADAIVAALADIATVNPAVSSAAANQITYLIQLSLIQPGQAMGDLNAMIGSPLTSDQAVGLFASMFSLYSSVVDINGLVGENLAQLLNAQTISPQQLSDGIAHGIANGGVTGEQAVLMYASIVTTHPELSDLATQGMISLVNATAIAPSALFGDISFALGNTADHGIGFMMNVAVNANAACVAAFGFYITSGSAIALIHDAYQQGISTPHAPGTITVQQELALLASALAAASGGGPASLGLPAIHAELVALITSHAATDTAVVAALEAVGLNNATIQAAVNTEIAALEAAIGPAMLIDVAQQTGADIAGVGSQLSSMLAQSQATISDIMAEIVAANGAGNLGNTQALAMIASLLGHSTGTGAFATMQFAGQDWRASTASALEQLAQHGLSPDAIGAAIEATTGFGPSLMSPDYAVSLLASMAAFSDLHAAAGAHISGLINNSGLNLYANNVATSIVNVVSAQPGHLHADDAVRLLALIAVSNNAPATYGLIVQGMDTTVLSPTLVASTIESMVHAGSLTGQQALHFLAPYGNFAPAAAGHALGDLIAENRISMADFAALIHGGISQDANTIQNTSYWQNVANTGGIDFRNAILALAAMTSQTPAALAELGAIAAADHSSVWAIAEIQLMNAGQHPSSTLPNLQEVVRALTAFVTDPAAVTAFGVNGAAVHLASDITSLVGPSMTLGDAFAQILSAGAGGSQALSDGVLAIIGAMYNTALGGNPSVATNPDVLFNAIGHGLTADQAVAILTGLSTSQTVDLQSCNLQSHIRMDLYYIIATSALSPAQVMSDIHNACVSDRIGAGSELALLAGIFGANNPNGATGTALIGGIVANGINNLISGGSLTLAQVMDGLAHGTYLPNTNIVTQDQRFASYLAGGLSSNSAAALMALVAAGSSDPAAPGAAAAEIAAMIASNRMTQALAMSGIDDMVTLGGLDPAKAVVLLASFPLNVPDSLHTAAGGEIAALVPGSITLDNAVAALVGMAHQGQTVQQLQAGAALGLLVAQNELAIATAVADIHAAVQAHALTADQAVAMLAGLNADAAPGVSTAVGNEIAAMIAQGEPAANVVSLLLAAAALGSASIQAGAGAVIGMLIAQHVVTVELEIQGIDTAFASGGLSASAATNLLLNLAGSGDTAAQAAVGQELGHIIQAANSTSGIATQLAASNLTQDQAVVVLAAAIAGATNSALQTQIAAMIQGLVTNGPISVAQVMSDIDGAVGHGLTAAQALTALAHLEEAGDIAMRQAILAETAALVTNHNVPVAEATAALLAAAHGGSTALQSLVGGMLASLADHGLLTNQQVSDAIGGAATLSSNEALGVLVGMGVNGSAAAQEASGAGIVTMILNGRVDHQTVISLIDTEVRHNDITAEHGLQVLVNIMGATIRDRDAGASGQSAAYESYIRDQMALEVASLTTNVAFHAGGAVGTLLNTACLSVALAEAVGRCFATMWAADLTTPNPVVRTGGPLVDMLSDLVANHRMTADEALMLALASSIGGQVQTILPGLVTLGAVTVDQTIHFLAVTAAKTGDTDTTNPYLAYTGFGGPDRQLMAAAIGDLQVLILGTTGVPPQATATTVMNDIVAAALAHDISGPQAASLLAVLAGGLGISDAITAAGGIATLVTQGQINNEMGLHAIGWATGSNGLTQAEANLMFASFALSADPAVQQIAIWAYNGLQLGPAMHAITQTSAFTHDQALTILATIAQGLGTPTAAGALAAEIVSMVTSHQMTADHAIAMLTGFAATSSFHLNNLGTELNALIAANAISFAQVVNDLMHSTLNANQLIVALTGMAMANSALDPLILSQITTMVHSGALTAAQAMADIGNAPPDVALRLLTQCGNSSTDIEDAAGNELAILWAQGPGVFYNFFAYAKANLDPWHAVGWIATVGAHGNAALQDFVDQQFHSNLYYAGSLGSYNIAELLTNFLSNSTPTAPVQYYIGQLLGRMIDHPIQTTTTVIAQNVLTAIEQFLAGTAARNELATTPGAPAGYVPKALTADVAAMVLLGLNTATHSSEAHVLVDRDLRLVSHDIDAQFLVNVAQVLGPQEALTQFVSMIQHGWASTALVAAQLGDMISHGTLTAQQVIAAMAPLDNTHQLALITDILAHGETNNAVLTSQFATLVLLTWGVAPTSQVYANMHDALMQVVPDFVGLARGTTTATQAINDVKGIAAAHGVMADLLLLAVYQSTAVDSGAHDFASSASGALSQVGRELYSHLTDGSTSLAVAQMVLNGSLPESVADTLLKDLAMSATIPPNQIMGSVQNGDMSVWYADAHYPGWSSNAGEVAFTVTQAVGMMHVDVHVAQDLAAVLAGTMSGAQAVADILHAAGGSEYAKDMGLMALVHGLDGTAAGAAALPVVDAEIAGRITSDASADALVAMTAHGWLPADQAVDFYRSEIAAATSHLDTAPAALLECIALARLDQSASGQVDPHATAQQQLIHGRAVSHAIENILEGADAAKILTGFGALQLIETDRYELGAGLALAQHVTQVLVAQMQAQEAAHPGSTGPASLSELAASMPPEMRQSMHFAEVASQYFNLGMGYAATGLADIKSGLQTGLHELERGIPVLGAAYTDINALRTDPGNIQRWVDLGVDLTLGGVPGNSLLMHVDLPLWGSGIQGKIIEAAVGEGVASAFNDVGVVAQVSVIILGIPAVQAGMHDGGATLGFMNAVNDTCSLINNMIAGTIHVAANLALNVAMDTYNTFKDICTGHDPSAAAEKLGKDLFVYTTGMNYDDIATVGADVGNAMIDIFSGNSQNLAADAQAIGLDTLKVITNNPYVQMAGNQLAAYNALMESKVSKGDALMIGFLV